MNENGVTLRSARESMRYLLRQRSVSIDETGLRIERDERKSSSQLNVDEVLERLGVLDVPASVAVLKRGGHAYLEVRVAFDDLHSLGRHLPEVNDAVSAVKRASSELRSS